MKTNKVLAIALSAGLVLGGSLSVSHADDNETGYASKDAAQKAASEIVNAKGSLNKGYSIFENKGKFYYQLTPELTGQEKEDDANVQLIKGKEAARKELQEKGITSEFLLKMIDQAKTLDSLKNAKEQLLKANAATPKLERLKEAAREELRKAGVKSQKSYDAITNAKTEQGLESLKKEILKSNLASKPKVTIDQWIVNQNDKDGYETPEEAKKAAELALKNDKINKSYTITMGANGRYFFLLSLDEEKKPEVKPNPDKKPEVKPTPDVKPGPTYDYEYPLIKPGKVDEDITLPELKESKEVEKEAKEKETTEVKEKSKAKENKKKEVKEVKKQAPARQAGRKNPKTGLESVAPVLSTLAISMAGIVATRKKNN